MTLIQAWLALSAMFFIAAGLLRMTDAPYTACVMHITAIAMLIIAFFHCFTS